MGRLEYSLTNEDYIAFNQYAAKHNPVIAEQSRRVRATGTIVAAVGGVVAFWLISREVFTTVLMAAAVAAAPWARAA